MKSRFSAHLFRPAMTAGTASLALLIFAHRAMADDPCPPPVVPDCTITCPLPTPTLTPVPSPTPISAPGTVSADRLPNNTRRMGTARARTVESQSLTANQAKIREINAGILTAQSSLVQNAEAQYSSVGSRWYLQPLDQGMSIPTVFAPATAFRSSTSVTEGKFANSFSPLTVQALYRDNMWGPTKEDQAAWAESSIFMVGAIMNSASNLETGEGKSRPATTNNPPWPFKWTVGSISQGQLVGPGTALDRFHALGSANFGYSAFSRSDLKEPGTGLDQLFAFAIGGSENGAFLGRWIGPDLTQPGTSGAVDGREASMREDDYWAPVPAIVNFMYGTTNQVWVDNKRVGFCEGGEPGANGENIAGLINAAWVTRSAVVANAANSWINLNEGKGLVTALSLGNALASPPDYFCGNERQGSWVGSWVGWEELPPYYDPCEVRVGAMSGAMVSDMSPLSGGGAPQLADVVGALPEGAARAHEAVASFIARGEVILGDGSGHEGQNYDTDVVHIKDVVRLSGRTAPPVISADTPPSERVGLLYFDVARNTLRVSVAVHDRAEEDWRQAEVAWVDLHLRTEAIEAADIVAGAKPGRTAPEKLVETKAATTGAVASGDSLFVEPRAQAVISRPASLQADSAVPVTLLVSGFQDQKPRIFWRRISGRGYLEAQTDWAEVPDGAFLQSDASLGIHSLELDLARPGNGGHPGRAGDPVKFLLIHPKTGQLTGASGTL